MPFVLGLLGAEDELGEVGGSGGNRHVAGEGRAGIGVEALEEAEHCRGARRLVDAHDGDGLHAGGDERLRAQEHAARSRGVDREHVRVGQSLGVTLVATRGILATLIAAETSA